MNKVPLDQLLCEVEDIIRTMPSTQAFDTNASNILAWLGRASAAMHAWDSLKAIADFDPRVRELCSSRTYNSEPAARRVLMMLHQAQHDLRMRTTGPLSLSVNKGDVFHYFDELRQVISLARKDLLFVDPYLDAEFVSRYLPLVAKGATIRLLGDKKIASLVSAAQLIAQQNALTVLVRSSPGLHDRYLFVDGATCYQSGASFKDGAKKSATTLTQITDAFAAVLGTYETLWASATLHS